MSKSLNKALLIGNVGADPEVRSTADGGKVAQFNLATSWGPREREKTQWHRVVCWNNPKGQQLADVVEQYVRKGDKVHVEGEIEYRQWEDKNGSTRYSTEIRARDIILLGGKAAGAADAPAKAASAPAFDGDEGESEIPF